jgi:hypothetical protein
MRRLTQPALRKAPGRACAAACAVGLLLAGCGSNGHDYANSPRPPVPIVISVSIDDQMVTVAPSHLGAGPVTLVITNQSKDSQQVTLEQDASSGPNDAAVQTGPINPRETAQIETKVAQGDYALRVGGDGVRGAHLVVGRERPSSQNDLLTP